MKQPKGPKAIVKHNPNPTPRPKRPMKPIVAMEGELRLDFAKGKMSVGGRTLRLFLAIARESHQSLETAASRWIMRAFRRYEDGERAPQK